MTNKNFKKIKKEFTPKQIIYRHCHNLIFLTSKQLDEIIKLENGEVVK